MYKVLVVCGSGIGTSMFAKKLVKEALVELGYDTGITVDCITAMEARGAQADILVTTEGIAKAIRPKILDGTKLVEVINIVNDLDAMCKALAPALSEDEALGKINKNALK